MDNNFNKVNNIVGWIIFAIALFVYAFTAESSGSLWDCGEFISGSYKLQVVHPPGAPLFLMLGRIFTMFAGGNESMVAYMVNFFSALSSAFAILFLFWIITALGRKLLLQEEKELSGPSLIALMGAGAVGALACTFSDTMWFSAVEGEVYALSTFFIAIVMWAILKWEGRADEPGANRWLVLIAYLIGLSIGVHLLSLLLLPIAVLVYYFKKYKVTTFRTMIALGVGMVALGVVQVGVIQLLTSIASSIEMTFVNDLNMPFNSGLLFTYAMVFAALAGFIFYTHRIKHADLQLIGLCLLFVLIGFSSYVMVPIRSNANTPINMNAPKDAFSLLSYLNREQYGDRPLLYGPLYDAKPQSIRKVKDIYYKNVESGKYEKKGEKLERVYRSSDKVLFPRLYSDDGEHKRLYKAWVGAGKNPTIGQNFLYFFKYQMGYMYWRYFMWNFAGRQDDFQGTADNRYKHGNWLSGIPPIDNARLGNQSGIPDQIKNHQSRNKFFFLPLIFGLLGLLYLLNRNGRYSAIFLFLFLMTGLALVVYFNSPPREPRERDYTLVGSYYTFCVWIGLGVLALYDMLKERLGATPSAMAATIIGLIAVPMVMGANGWNDHNRRDRYMARDFGINYLESCPPNAILFTQGDNDTYPLWYAQEVEGVRPDVRVANLSLLGVDWYIDFLQRASNENGPVPFVKSFTPDKYRGNNRDITTYMENKNVAKPKEFYPAEAIVDFMVSDDKRAQAMSQNGDRVNYFPTKNLKLKVDKQAVLDNGIVDPKDADKIVDEMIWTLKKNNLIKYDLALLAMIAAGDWSRPICIANTVHPKYYNGLNKYLVQEGLMYKLVPIEHKGNSRQISALDGDVMYDRVMNKFVYGGLDAKKHFIDENTHRMMHILRGAHFSLAEALTSENKSEKAVAVLERVKEKFIYENCPYYSPFNDVFNMYSMQWIDLYYRNGRGDLAKEVTDLYIRDMADAWRFYNMPSGAAVHWQEEMQRTGGYIQRLELIAQQYKDDELLASLADNFPEVVSGNTSRQIQQELELKE